MNMKDNSLTMSQWLTKATKQLEAAGIGTARLDALVLLEDITGKDRTHLLAHPEFTLTTEQQNHLQKLLDHRAGHEPLAYIRQKTEFYGREFFINSSVLEPRPESETMIDLLKVLRVEQRGLSIVDVGTGSGALAITAALELPESHVFAVDIDKNCLSVAEQNAKKHSVNIEFIESNLLERPTLTHLSSPIYILANLPYVPDEYHINEAALQEPRIAIFGGPDGLDLYRIMFKQINKYFDQRFFVFTESLPFQHTELMNIAAAQNYKQVAEEDFIQVFQNIL
jgi:release factor glutamine methyltransferase